MTQTSPTPGAQQRSASQLADLHIRVRGKALQMRRALVGQLLVSGAVAPLLWEQWHAGPLAGSAEALLVIGLGALLVSQFVTLNRTISLCLDPHRKFIDRRRRDLEGASRRPQVVGIALGSASLAMLVAAGAAIPAGQSQTSALLAAASALLFSCTAILYTLRFPGRREQAAPMGQQRRLTQDGRPDLSIACSGGGIRSAAFCLGALQRLRRPDDPGRPSLYDQAQTVYSVSGGGYIATGLHAARTCSDQGADEVFSAGSPEEDRLRRTSSYLMATVKNRTLGLLSLVFGLMVNLVLLVSVLGILAWWMAWWLRGSGALSSFDSWFPQFPDGTTAGPPAEALDASLDIGALPWWVRAAVVVAGLAVALFVVLKVVRRLVFGREPRYQLPEGSIQLSAALEAVIPKALWGGLAAVVLLIGVPVAIDGVSTATIDNRPTPAVASLTAQLGFASSSICKTAAEQSFVDSRGAAEAAGRPTFDYGACGKFAEDVPLSVTAASCKPVDPDADAAAGTDCAGFVDDVPSTSWVGGAVAFIATLSGIVATIMRAPRRLSVGRLGRGGAWLRSRLLPWIGSALVVLVVAVGFLKMTYDLTLRDPWKTAPVFERTWLLYGAALALLAVKVLVDATSASMHPFYRRRLAETFLLHRRDGLAEPLPYDVPQLLSERRPDRLTGPGLVVCAAANVSDAEFIPTQRECTPFRFATHQPGADGSPPVEAHIGLSDHWRLPDGLRPAAAFEAAADPYRREVTLASAMAISGAAVSPRTGRANRRSRPYRLLLALANARLGVWLPNPYWVEDASGTATPAAGSRSRARAWLTFLRTYLDKPGPFRLVEEAVGTSSVYARRIYITDGGHYDNTALVEALRDHPRRLIVIDASNDPQNNFYALGDAIATARMDLGVEVTLADVESLKSDGDAAAKKAWTSGLARPTDIDDEESSTTILVVKAILFEGVPLDLELYKERHDEFPRTSTGDQLYGEYDFESYRRLGYEAMTRALEDERHGQAFRAGSAPMPDGVPPTQPKTGQSAGPEPVTAPTVIRPSTDGDVVVSGRPRARSRRAAASQPSHLRDWYDSIMKDLQEAFPRHRHP